MGFKASSLYERDRSPRIKVLGIVTPFEIQSTPLFMVYSRKLTLNTSGVNVGAQYIPNPTLHNIEGHTIIIDWKTSCIWETSNKVKSNPHLSHTNGFESIYFPKHMSTKSKCSFFTRNIWSKIFIKIYSWWILVMWRAQCINNSCQYKVPHYFNA